MDSLASAEPCWTHMTTPLQSVPLPALPSPSASDGNEQGDAEEFESSEDIPAPPHCIPVRADVRTFDWKMLAARAGPFDVVLMDPPWQLAGARPTRGVALSYTQMPLADIAALPVPALQPPGGYLAIWVINSTYVWTLRQLKTWGYTLCDDVAWLKATRHGRFAKGHGYYLQHAKETLLVARKNAPHTPPPQQLSSDVLVAPRRSQSEKPREIYPILEQLAPQGKYLEIFARPHNLRNFWISLGLEM